jgi:hypothetical protein
VYRAEPASIFLTVAPLGYWLVFTLSFELFNIIIKERTSIPSTVFEPVGWSAVLIFQNEHFDIEQTIVNGHPFLRIFTCGYACWGLNLASLYLILAFRGKAEPTHDVGLHFITQASQDHIVDHKHEYE